MCENNAKQYSTSYSGSLSAPKGTERERRRGGERDGKGEEGERGEGGGKHMILYQGLKLRIYYLYLVFFLFFAKNEFMRVF